MKLLIYLLIIIIFINSSCKRNTSYKYIYETTDPIELTYVYPFETKTFGFSEGESFSVSPSGDIHEGRNPDTSIHNNCGTLSTYYNIVDNNTGKKLDNNIFILEGCEMYLPDTAKWGRKVDNDFNSNLYVQYISAEPYPFQYILDTFSGNMKMTFRFAVKRKVYL